MTNYSGLWRMRPQRAHRKEQYRNEGLLPFEQEALSNVPLYVPYAISFRKDRANLYRRAVAEKWSKTKYIEAVRFMYEVRGWWTPGIPFSATNAFHALKSYEVDWRQSADPNDPYLLMRKRKHRGTKEPVNLVKRREEHKRYNALPSTKAKRAKYRLEHRAEIREAERKRRAFKARTEVAQ